MVQLYTVVMFVQVTICIFMFLFSEYRIQKLCIVLCICINLPIHTYTYFWCLYPRARPRLIFSSPRSLRNPFPAASMWLRRQTIPCSWLSPLKLLRLLSCPSHQWNPPPWRTQTCAAFPITLRCRRTWTSPQDWLRSRNTSRTPFCRSPDDHQSVNSPMWLWNTSRHFEGRFSYHDIFGHPLMTCHQTVKQYWHDYTRADCNPFIILFNFTLCAWVKILFFLI